jgi:hypothetical protein
MEIPESVYAKAFIIAIIFSITGAFLKINHIEYSSIFLTIGVVSNLLYIIVGINEVNSSTRIQNSEKVLWTIGFLVFNFFVGIYYLIKRKNIV